MPPRILANGETNVGMKRSHNEDNYKLLDAHQLYIVADGMGGHASGEVASKMACETLEEFFEHTQEDPEATWPYKMDKSRGYEENRLVTGIKLANLRIFESAQADSKMRGMGTTLVAMRVLDDGVLVAHVGDSRVYRLRNGELAQLTEDHSLLNDYIKMKKLTEEEIANFPHKNVIVRALGMKENVKVDLVREAPMPGDIYLLCTDGLSGPASDAEIREILANTADLGEACSKLVAKANEHGGPDNVTVIAAKVVGVG